MIKLTDEDRAKYTPKKKQTNLEKIKAMSAEELIELVVRLHNACYFCSGRRDCHAIGKVLHRDCAIKNWLESEVEE